MPKSSLLPSTPKQVAHNSALRDNRSHGKVGDWLQEVMATGSKLSIVSAYFTVNAYAHLREELNGIESLRFLFGDPAYLRIKDADKGERSFRITDEGLAMAAQMQQRAIAKACAEWLEKKAEIRSLVKPNFLHGKLFHVVNPNKTEDALMGSSNFTAHGLGLGTMPNMELNMVINDRRDREELKQWFEELWEAGPELVVDVKDRVLADLRELYMDTPPEFVYFKTLFHVFEKFLQDQGESGLLDERTGFFDSEVWNKLYAFQKDGVKGAINKVLRHGGCIIADSVGLGKTFEALAIIKYFELLNKNVLVLCPKKLAPNWTVYQSRMGSTLNPFTKDRFQYAVMCHSDLGRTGGVSSPNAIPLDQVNWGAYDLVVIDESHNFKGNPKERELEDGTRKINRAHFLLEEVIRKGVRTRVLLLSATPVNNNLRDLRNQINLIAGGSDNGLFETTGVADIGETLRLAQTQFTQWADPTHKDRRVRGLLEKLDSAFFKLLDELTIARSRSHVKRFYAGSDAGEFPKRDKPVSIYPQIDLEGRFPSYDAINTKISGYTLAVFNPSAFLKEGAKEKYEFREGKQIEAFTQERREHFLTGMMKVNFLKRLESSVHSFQVSMDRTIGKIDALLKRIEEYGNRPDPQVKLSFDQATPNDTEQDDSGEEEQDWTVGKKEYHLTDLRLDEWKEALRLDRDQLNELFLLARGVDAKHDAKLFELKRIIMDKAIQPFNDANKKVLVFTAFADTAHYIYDSLQDFARHEVKLNMALVTGSGTRTQFGANDFNSILTNFSPASKERNKHRGMPTEGEIDILIASDCISEGQNLQDCDLIVNYDIHWNPVRIIQRFGRIDRLGSTNARIRLVNFWPTEDLDGYINLKHRVEARMALVDITATGEDNILNTEQIEDLVNEDLKYRDRQLKRLKDEVLDLEDMGENISLTDLTLDDFRTELLTFLKGNEARLKNAPFGLYAVVPSGQHALGEKQYDLLSGTLRDQIRPGTVLCLRQRNTAEQGGSVNQLHPYYLVYVRDDGTVRYSYTAAKQVLELFRLLCAGRPEAYETLCRQFDTETGNGTNMQHYDGLMRKAAADIARLSRQRSANKLGTDRGGLLIPDAQLAGMPDDFDLVTWLVIK
ncbi:MAG: DEAD/DEAH box helicase [Flavobacteriales bacterium]|nr:DEAD/DEAH box helicase [Flavobacteriales bacterium]